MFNKQVIKVLISEYKNKKIQYRRSTKTIFLKANKVKNLYYAV